jgi:RND family efflux transporter MFP subunit
VKEGDLVRKGQLLAQLDMTEIEAQATQAKFAVEKAMRDRQRVENLYRDSIATLEQYQNAGTAVDMAKKSLQIAEFNVAYSQIRSPIEGKVIKQLMEEGEITGPGVPVYYIMGVQQSDWKIVAGLTDKNWGKIKKGEKAKITLDAYPGWIIDSEVKRLSDVANPLSGTLDVELSIPSKDNRIAAGMLAHIEIIPSVKADYIIIPVEALVSSNGRTGVVYVPKDGVAEKRTVMIQQFEGERVAIQSGLEGATEVITAGSGFLEDGDKISIENK